MLKTRNKYVSQNSKQTRGKLPAMLCHSLKISAIRSISLIFELWKFELTGVTAVEQGIFVQ